MFVTLQLAFKFSNILHIDSYFYGPIFLVIKIFTSRIALFLFVFVMVFPILVYGQENKTGYLPEWQWLLFMQ